MSGEGSVLRVNRYIFNRRQYGWPAVLLAALLLWFLPAPAGAAPGGEDGPVRIKAEVGWQGWGMPDRHIPAVVTLQNTGGQDLAGVVEAINYYHFMPPPPPPGSPPNTVLPPRDVPATGYGERISLPAGGEKKLTLWFPMHGTGKRVDFVFRSGANELARVTTSMPGNDVSGPMPMTVGVLGPVPPALERTRLLMPDGVIRAPKVKEITADLFPIRGEQLDAFQTILVTAPGSAMLDEGQRRALAEWVELGGQLVVSGGLDIEQTLAALPENTITINVEQIEQRSGWQEEAAWLETSPPAGANAAAARLQGAGEPWGPEDNPLGLRFALGPGYITVLEFDPGQLPWRAGALGEALWKKFLTPENRDDYYKYMPPGYQMGNLVHHTNSLPREVFPNWRPVALYLLVFLLAAGPCTYLVLRRMRRPEYTWVAVPLLAVLFAGGVYGYMVTTGGNVLVNVVQVADAREAGKPAGFTAVGFFAPTRGDFTAVLDDPDLAVQVQAMGGKPMEMMDEDDPPQYRVIRGSDLEVHFSDLSQWNMRGVSFRNNRLAEEAAGLTATVEVQGNTARGRVHNDTGLELDHVTLFWGYRYKVLGDLKPGEEKTVDMDITVPQYNPQGHMRHETANVWQVFQYPGGPPEPPKPGAPYSPPPNRQLSVDEQRRVQLAGSWTENIRRHGPVERGWPLVLLAWSDSSTGGVGTRQFHRPPTYLTLFVQQPQIKLPGGNFSIPAGLVIPEVAESRVRGMFGHNNLTGIDGGTVSFAFKPRFGLGVKINEITVGFDCFPVQSRPGGGMGPPGPNPAPVPAGALEIYHPGRGDWVELSGSRTFDLDGAYAAANGEVRLRVTGGIPDQGTAFYFQPPTVAYGGESQ